MSYFEYGVTLEREFDFDGAFKAFRAGHEKGDLQAGLRLSKYCMAGRGTVKDENWGFELLLRLGKGGMAEAMYDIAQLYDQVGLGLGVGPPEDEVGLVRADRDFLFASREVKLRGREVKLDMPFSRALADTSRHDALVESLFDESHTSHLAKFVGRCLDGAVGCRLMFAADDV